MGWCLDWHTAVYICSAVQLLTTWRLCVCSTGWKFRHPETPSRLYPAHYGSAFAPPLPKTLGLAHLPRGCCSPVAFIRCLLPTHNFPLVFKGVTPLKDLFVRMKPFSLHHS